MWPWTVSSRLLSHRSSCRGRVPGRRRTLPPLGALQESCVGHPSPSLVPPSACTQGLVATPLHCCEREGVPSFPRDALRGRPHLFLPPTKGGGTNTPYMQEASL